MSHAKTELVPPDTFYESGGRFELLHVAEDDDERTILLTVTWHEGEGPPTFDWGCPETLTWADTEIISAMLRYARAKAELLWKWAEVSSDE